VAGERRIGDTVRQETREDLSRLPADTARIGRAVRAHGSIENSLQGVLAVAFREDGCRVRSGHAAQTFAMLRHMARNLRRRETTAKVGTTAQRLMCGWDATRLRTALAASCGCPAIAVRHRPICAGVTILVTRATTYQHPSLETPPHAMQAGANARLVSHLTALFICSTKKEGPTVGGGPASVWECRGAGE
jgi:hypothetical protein